MSLRAPESYGRRSKGCSEPAGLAARESPCPCQASSRLRQSGDGALRHSWPAASCRDRTRSFGDQGDRGRDCCSSTGAGSRASPPAGYKRGTSRPGRWARSTDSGAARGSHMHSGRSSWKSANSRMRTRTTSLERSSIHLYSPGSSAPGCSRRPIAFYKEPHCHQQIAKRVRQVGRCETGPAGTHGETRFAPSGSHQPVLELDVGHTHLLIPAFVALLRSRRGRERVLAGSFASASVRLHPCQPLLTSLGSTSLPVAVAPDQLNQPASHPVPVRQASTIGTPLPTLRVAESRCRQEPTR